MKDNIVAEIKVTYSTGCDLRKRPTVTCSFEAYQIFRDSWDPNLIQYVEQFKILLLTKSYNAIGIVNISTGGVSSTIVDPRMVFGPAIKANASGIVLCHNHPSGCLSPSAADISLTNKIIKGAKLFDMTVTDHLIISHLSFLSMADKGLL